MLKNPLSLQQKINIMYKLPYLITILLLLVLLTSCEGRNKKRAMAVVQEFCAAYKNENQQEMSKLYPEMQNLMGDFYKSDKMNIKGIIKKESEYIVFCENEWTNGFGKTFTREMRFYVKENNNINEKYFHIFDSKGFVSLDDTNIYKFSVKIGAINISADSTDLMKSKKLSNVTPIFDKMKEKMREAMINGIYYSGLNWETEFNCASGRITLTNNGNFPIKDLEYRISYKTSKNGTLVASDEGIVCYGWLNPGESKSISWFTNNVSSNAHWADVNVVINPSEDWLGDVLLDLPFHGDEYSQLQ